MFSLHFEMNFQHGSDKQRFLVTNDTWRETQLDHLLTPGSGYQLAGMRLLVASSYNDSSSVTVKPTEFCDAPKVLNSTVSLAQSPASQTVVVASPLQSSSNRSLGLQSDSSNGAILARQSGVSLKDAKRKLDADDAKLLECLKKLDAPCKRTARQQQLLDQEAKSLAAACPGSVFIHEIKVRCGKCFNALTLQKDRLRYWKHFHKNHWQKCNTPQAKEHHPNKSITAAFVRLQARQERESVGMQLSSSQSGGSEKVAVDSKSQPVLLSTNGQRSMISPNVAATDRLNAFVAVPAQTLSNSLPAHSLPPVSDSELVVGPNAAQSSHAIDGILKLPSKQHGCFLFNQWNLMNVHDRKVKSGRIACAGISVQLAVFIGIRRWLCDDNNNVKFLVKRGINLWQAVANGKDVLLDPQAVMKHAGLPCSDSLIIHGTILGSVGYAKRGLANLPESSALCDSIANAVVAPGVFPFIFTDSNSRTVSLTAFKHANSDISVLWVDSHPCNALGKPAPDDVGRAFWIMCPDLQCFNLFLEMRFPVNQAHPFVMVPVSAGGVDSEVTRNLPNRCGVCKLCFVAPVRLVRSATLICVYYRVVGRGEQGSAS